MFLNLTNMPLTYLFKESLKKRDVYHSGSGSGYIISRVQNITLMIVKGT